MKSLNLRKLSLLSLLAGSLVSYDANAAAEATEEQAPQSKSTVPTTASAADLPRITRPVVADPTADEVAAAIRPVHRTLIQNCFPCCSAEVQERFGDWIGVAARGFSFAAEHGDDVLDAAESIFGKSEELDALKRAQARAAGINNELSLVLNPKTGEFLEWDDAFKRSTTRFSSLAKAEYLKIKNDLHPAARLVISYFLDNAFDLVLGAGTLSKDPASLYKRLEEARKQFIDMLKEDGKSGFTLSAIGDTKTARLKMVDEDGDGKLELGVAIAAREGTVSFVDLVNQAKEATADLLTNPESQRIDFARFPLLGVLNNEYHIVNDDGTFKKLFKATTDVAATSDAVELATAAAAGTA
tara:strand:- start:138 stop:1205 length:1068 start_codon:yes stop_codon:yes gene_type:complete